MINRIKADILSLFIFGVTDELVQLAGAAPLGFAARLNPIVRSCNSQDVFS